MANDCFENFEHEEILNCPNDDLQAGLAEGEIYYAPVDFIQTMNLPQSSSSMGFAESVTINDNITMLPGKGFKRLRCQTNMNSLASNLVGNAGNKKDQSTLALFLAGFRDVLLGFKKQMKNVPACFIVKDRNGRQFLMGTKINPARLDQFELTTGATQEDDNGGTATIISNYTVFEYKGDIPLATDPDVEVIGVSVTPSTDSVVRGGTKQFSASVTPSGASQSVVWTIESATGLTISSSGLVSTTASTPEGEYDITATSSANNEIAGTATITVTTE